MKRRMLWTLLAGGIALAASTATAAPAAAATSGSEAFKDTSVTAGTSGIRTVPTAITADNTAPAAVIDTPTAALTWQVGQVISFSGHATDAEDGTLPASRLSWSAILHHCRTPTDCHTHLIQTFAGVASGAFSAPDHEYPCWLEIQLSALDSGGLTSTASVRLDPKTVVLTFKTNPTGLKLTDLMVNETSQATPFSAIVVVGSSNTVSAPYTQIVKNSTYYFTVWSDGGAQSHTIVAPVANATYTASYRKS